MKTVATVSRIYRIALLSSLITAGVLSNQAAVSRNYPSKNFTAPVPSAAPKKTESILAQESVRKARSFDQFVAAIHQVETAGNQGRLYGDGGRSYGPLQISYATWKDATRYA